MKEEGVVSSEFPVCLEMKGSRLPRRKECDRTCPRISGGTRELELKED